MILTTKHVAQEKADRIEILGRRQLSALYEATQWLILSSIFNVWYFIPVYDFSPVQNWVSTEIFMRWENKTTHLYEDEVMLDDKDWQTNSTSSLIFTENTESLLIYITMKVRIIILPHVQILSSNYATREIQMKNSEIRIAQTSRRALGAVMTFNNNRFIQITVLGKTY